ncbi:MAG: ABC transporter ATP-binding protein [Spirochaetales bacterium]|nr:ABC transporter ATP-binding protein [Spirochaetales bacterium]
MKETLLQLENLSVHFEVGRKRARAVDRISLSLKPGETHALVGESGCGKSVTALAIMGLLPQRRVHTAGRIMHGKCNLLELEKEKLRQMRGRDMGIIFQEPMTALNPVITVGDQVREAVSIHPDRSLKPGQSPRDRVLELLAEMGLRDPVSLYRRYPHELSGGMRQRVMIAIALACNPSLLIADEPTTALDVTVQKQILDLLKKLQEFHEMAVLLITHNMGVVGRVADSLSVMYAGQIVESGPTRAIFEDPCHPYTRALFAALPGRSQGRSRLAAIGGSVPPATQYDSLPSPCRFFERCQFQNDECHKHPKHPEHSAFCPRH